MTVTPKALQGMVQLGTTDPTEGNGKYTSPALTKTIIVTASAYNTSGAAVTVITNLVRSGGGIAAGNVVYSTSVAAGAIHLFPELINKTLEAGDFLSFKASTAAVINFEMSGRLVT